MDVISKTLGNILGTKHTKIHSITSGGKLPKPTQPKYYKYSGGKNYRKTKTGWEERKEHRICPSCHKKMLIGDEFPEERLCDKCAGL